MDKALREWFNERAPEESSVSHTKHDTTYYEEAYAWDESFPAPVIEGTTHVLLSIGRSYSWGPDWGCATYITAKEVKEVVTVTKVTYVPV